MSRDRVVVRPRGDVSLDRYADGYLLIWYLTDEGEFGATLDGRANERDLSHLTGDWWESVAMDVEAKAVASHTGAVQCVDGLVWPSKNAAAAALRAIKARVVARRAQRPWPEWATQAFAAGWKPPKGWAP